MSKLFLFNWVWILSFIFFLFLSTISQVFLIRIKKREYRNLWEKEKKAQTFWYSPERKIWDELLLNTPHWANQDKNAKLWLLVFRSSIVLSILFFAAPFIYIFIGMLFY